VIAVGTLIAERPPHRSVRAAFPHTAPTSGRWRPARPQRSDARHTLRRYCARHAYDVRSRFPRSSRFAPPAPPPVTWLCSPVSSLLWLGLISRARASSATAPHLPDADRCGTKANRPDARPPRFRCSPFARDVAFDPGGASAPRIAVPHILPSTTVNVSASAIFGISWLNPTPHTIAVYASRPPSPTSTQHSLSGGRYPLPEPDSHRLDCTSLSWRTTVTVIPCRLPAGRFFR